MHDEAKEYKFRVTELEKTTATDGKHADNWYRYVITK